MEAKRTIARPCIKVKNIVSTTSVIYYLYFVSRKKRVLRTKKAIIIKIFQEIATEYCQCFTSSTTKWLTIKYLIATWIVWYLISDVLKFSIQGAE